MLARACALTILLTLPCLDSWHAPPLQASDKLTAAAAVAAGTWANALAPAVAFHLQLPTGLAFYEALQLVVRAQAANFDTDQRTMAGQRPLDAAAALEAIAGIATGFLALARRRPGEEGSRSIMCADGAVLRCVFPAAMLPRLAPFCPHPHPIYPALQSSMTLRWRCYAGRCRSWSARWVRRGASVCGWWHGDGNEAAGAVP